MEKTGVAETHAKVFTVGLIFTIDPSMVKAIGEVITILM